MQLLQRRASLILVLVLGVVWIIYSADRTGSATGGKIPAPQVDFLAPDFTLMTPEGEAVTLSELRGRAVLLNLWATWCPPCRAEMPAIQKLYDEYKDAGFTVLAVNMTYQDDPNAVTPFFQEYGLTFPLLLDITGEVGAKYELRSLPSSFFIDRTGTIKEVVIGGPMSEALLRTRIESLLE
jgi:peroxiredoxin